MQNSQESITYKADGGGSLPEFLAIFWRFFVIFFGLKNFKGPFIKIMSSFLSQTFCTDRVDILLCYEKKKTGGFLSKFGTLAPSK